MSWWVTTYRITITAAVLFLMVAGAYSYGWQRGSKVGVEVTVMNIQRSCENHKKIILHNRTYVCVTGGEL
jgi:hypothetical protein